MWNTHKKGTQSSVGVIFSQNIKRPFGKFVRERFAAYLYISRGPWETVDVVKTHFRAHCVPASLQSSCTAHTAAAAHLHGPDPFHIGGGVRQQGARQVKGRSSAPGTRPPTPQVARRRLPWHRLHYLCVHPSPLLASPPPPPQRHIWPFDLCPPQGRGRGRAPGEDAGAEQRQDGQERGEVCPSMIVISEKHNQEM